MTDVEGVQPEEPSFDSVAQDERGADKTTGGALGRLNGLSDGAANVLAAGERPTVVVLAGNVRTGKTTLLASLYERFGHGPIAGWQFAGSNTLPAFEARAQGIRPVDGSSGPMPHTRTGALPWLHLAARSPAGETRHLLFGDFDGELFRRLIDRDDSASDTPALFRADHLMVVIDADGLSKPRERQRVRRDVSELIGALAREQAGISSSVYSLIVTKTDAFRGLPEARAEWAQNAIDELYRQARSDFAASAMELVNTAAVSVDPELPIGHGLESLLELWWRKPAAQPWGQAFAEVPADADTFSRFVA